MSVPPPKRIKKEMVKNEKDTCYVCGKQVANLTNHLNSHSIRLKFPFECHYCHSKFKTEEMQIEHVQNHKDIPCSICGKVIEIERYEQHLDNHRREKETNIQSSTSQIPNSEIIFCPFCQIEFLASDENKLQNHIQKNHQETNSDSSMPKIKQKPPNKKQVEEHNRILIQRNVQLTTQLDDERKDKELYIRQLNNLNRQHCDLNEKNLKQTEELTQVRKELAEMKRAKERVHESKEEKSPINSDYQAGPSTSMPEPILSTLELENQQNLPPVHEKIQNTTPTTTTVQEREIVHKEEIRKMSILKCTRCDFKAKNAPELKLHLIQIHQVENKECDWEKYFRSNFSIEILICSFCNEIFNTQKELKNHRKMHEGEGSTIEAALSKVINENFKQLSEKINKPCDQCSKYKDECDTLKNLKNSAKNVCKNQETQTVDEIEEENSSIQSDPQAGSSNSINTPELNNLGSENQENLVSGPVHEGIQTATATRR